MNNTPLPKAVKPVWCIHLPRLPCLLVYVKFQFVYASTSQIGSQPLLASTSSRRGSGDAFNENLEVSNAFPSAV